VETDPEKDPAGKEGEEDVMVVDNIDSDEIPLGRKYEGSMVKRLRSSKEEAVSSKAENLKTRTKNIGTVPKKG
jgi:hypothetical protein